MGVLATPQFLFQPLVILLRQEHTMTMATGAVPSYNTDHPATLFAPGRLRGLAIQLSSSSITPLAGTGGRIYRATLSGPNSLPHLRGGQFATVAVKVTDDDRTRRPRDPKREARILADLDHPNVRLEGPMLYSFINHV